MQKRSSICTLFVVGFTFHKISIMMKNFQFFSLGEIVFLSKQSKAHPRQMQLGMRSFQALLAQTSPGSCDMSFNYTVLPINSRHFQNYVFRAPDFLKGGKVADDIYFFTES